MEQQQQHIQCQFSLSGLDISDKSKLCSLIHASLSEAVGSDNILGCMLSPRNWPQRAVVLCKDDGVKETLLQNGLQIDGKAVELMDGGAIIKRVLVDDAPFDMPHAAIATELGKLGKVSGGTNLPYMVDRVKTSWISGTRLFYLSNQVGVIPPTITVAHENVDVKLCLRHEGQTLFECRFCHEHVSRSDHKCEKKPVKKCFNCNKPGHMNFQCKETKLCHKCKSPDHLARDCPPTSRSVPGQRKFLPARRPRGMTLGDAPVVPPRRKRKRAATGVPTEDPNAGTAEATLGPTNSSVGPDGADADPAAGTSASSPTATSVISDAYGRMNKKLTVDALMLGDSNSRDLSLKSDDSMEIKLQKIWEGGAQINDAMVKFDEMPNDVGLSRKQVVITNVGACDFPVNSDADIDRLFLEYVELLACITRRCSNARVYMTGILPRKGDLNSPINIQRAKMNAKLDSLSLSEENHTFVDVDVFLTDGSTTLPDLYSNKTGDDIHLSSKGKERVACAIVDYIRNDHYRELARVEESDDEGIPV